MKLVRPDTKDAERDLEQCAQQPTLMEVVP